MLTCFVNILGENKYETKDLTFINQNVNLAKIHFIKNMPWRGVGVGER